MPIPKVHIIATGGTIGFTGVDRLDAVRYGERGRPILIDALLDRIPQVRDFADVTAEQPIVEGWEGQSMGPKEWVQVANRCNDLFGGADPPAGIVVTHGTYVLEETAYFLNLTVRSDHPVVLTGAQRPSTALSSDADMNLFNAVLAAGAPDSKGKGVLAILNHEINAARDVTKTSVYRFEAFESRDLGFLGYVESDGAVVYYRAPTRRHTWQSEFTVPLASDFPWVDIVFSYAGDDGRSVDALVEKGGKGLVLTGGFPGVDFNRAVGRAREKGVTIVRAGHMGSGRVIRTPRMTESGTVAADNLSPKKARILLMLALGVTSDPDEIQRMFDEY